MIAQVRRNSHLAYLKLQDQLASATSSAQAAYKTVTDTLIDTWSESDLKNFCDKNSINGGCLPPIPVYAPCPVPRYHQRLLFAHIWLLT